jgi:hypothetical protein
MKVRLQSSSLRFEEEERRELQKQQNQMKTKRNLQHRLDQALRKRLTQHIQQHHGSIPMLLTLKKYILSQSRGNLHNELDYENALQYFDVLVQQQLWPFTM